MLRPGKHWYLPAVLALTALAGGPLLVQLRLLEPLQGFLIFGISAVLGTISILWGFRLAGLKETKKAAVLVVLGFVPLGIILPGMAAGQKVPRLNDVSTDLDNPPRFDDGKPYPDEFRDLVRKGYPDLISKTLDMPPAQAFAKVKATAQAMPGWELGKTDDQAMTVHGTQTTRLFRFVDDFAVRVEPIDGRAVVAMRSRSRDGKGDFGVNAERIRDFFAALDL